jgi:oxygen-independent coproporphyrinogen-3 oxidase
VPEPEEDIVAEMYEVTQGMLAEAGFEHYEISNWARGESANLRVRNKPIDYRSRHNLVYWRNEPYFGFGCGAHSSHARQRYWNVLRPRDYIATIAATGEAVAERETIDRALEMGETSMLGLRLIGEGVDRARFADRFGVELDDMFGSVIARLIDQGLIESHIDRILLTPRGRLLGNRVFAEFLPDAH